VVWSQRVICGEKKERKRDFIWVCVLGFLEMLGIY
jgi:hypothetical protein